jgi:TonB family protein
MKHVLVAAYTLIAFATLVTAADPEIRYLYENKFTWDKKKLDSPPLPIGGEPVLAKGLDYPRDLRRQGIQGKATVSVTVDAAGQVLSISFSPHLPHELEKIVIKAVRQCQWKPGKKRGALVTGEVSFPVSFVISEF